MVLDEFCFISSDIHCNLLEFFDLGLDGVFPFFHQLTEVSVLQQGFLSWVRLEDYDLLQEQPGQSVR